MHARFETHSHICFGFYHVHSATNSAEFEKLNESVKNLQLKSKFYTT